MARKKFKTVAGYLRSMGDDLYYKQETAQRQGRPAISDAEGKRQILNNLLPQIGIAGCIGSDEKPVDAIKRLREAAQTERDIKNLDACLKWLRVPPTPMHMQFIGASSSVTGVGMMFRGESFTPEETQAIEKIQRERRLPSIADAIRIYREGTAGGDTAA
jgi:CRISPR/Cas system type I-B associated protein Csh2 (Cas7 group RAMP superfamily)